MQPERPPARIRVLVVDDEPLARSNLTVLLPRQPDIEVIGECGSGREALAAIRANRPDLVFLDVQMPECDGFDVLELIGGDLPPAIVFVTAYDRYALRAFEVGALDYLLKPFDDARFELALGRARERLRQRGNLPARIERVVVKSAGQVLFLKAAEIDWIAAADYYASLHVGPRTHLLRRTLSELEQELDPGAFCRIHRSTIINIDRLRSLEMGADGEYEACLKDGTRLGVSRRYRKSLQDRLSL
jgi:two-component system, LytTR family, response regulator